jgi:3-deoxy-D-arabino-heptulosonate 7-phosphate (DAHP) synthase class II
MTLTLMYESINITSGGYADISRLHAWNLDFVENLPAGNRYREMSSKVTRHPSLVDDKNSLSYALFR